MGFASDPVTGDIRIELAHRAGGAYDAMLHIGNTPAIGRTIAFRRIGNQYRWINEQEQHIGPKTYQDADGNSQQEMLFIIHQTEPLTGIPVNQTIVMYFGADPRLQGVSLTVDGVRPILREWDTLQQQQRR